MKRVAQIVESLLLWLLPVAWMIFCAVEFSAFEPDPKYKNAGGFLLLAFAWLFELRVIRRSIPAQRARAWGMAASVCATALVAGLLLFIVIPGNWAGLGVFFLSLIALGLTMPREGNNRGLPTNNSPAGSFSSDGEEGRAAPIVLAIILVVLIGGGSIFYLLGGTGGQLKRQQIRAFFGVVDDQVALAWRYREGDGVTQDFAKAATWFEKAANSGSAKAQYDLGVLRYYGLGTGEDAAKARESFTAAARQDYGPAVTMLGLMAQDEHDTGNAIQLWQRAVSLKEIWAEYLLGTAYLSLQNTQGQTSQSREKNLARAIFWLEKARQDGAEPIGGMLRHVWANVPPDSLERVTEEVMNGLKEGVAP